MRAILVSVLAAAVVALAACGGGRDRDREPAAKPVDGADASASAPASAMAPGASAQNDAGLKATITNQKQRDKALWVWLRLENTGSKTVLFKNPEGMRVSGFKVAAADREPQGADAGRYAATKSQASKLTELAPGSDTEIELKWTFDPKLPKESYAYTLTVTNLFAGEERLGEIVVQGAPGSTK